MKDKNKRGIKNKPRKINVLRGKRMVLGAGLEPARVSP